MSRRSDSAEIHTASERRFSGWKKIRLLGGFLMLFFFLLLPAKQISAYGELEVLQFQGVRSYTNASRALELANQERVRAGKKKLNMGTQLQEDAMKRAEEIAVFFSHVRPSGESCFSAFTNDYSKAGENIAAGHENAGQVTEDWMASRLHRQNILDPDFTEIGIGCFKADGFYYWVELFGRESYGGKGKTGNKKVTARVAAEPDCLNLRLDVGEAAEGMKEGEAKTLLVYNQNTGEGWDGRLTLTGTAFCWNSSSPETAVVSGTRGRGRVTALRKGTARITASLGKAFARGTVKITSHNWREKVTKKATVFQKGEKTYTCQSCGKVLVKETEKLKPVLKINVKSLTLTVRQKTTAVRVTAARGDRVVSWKSSNSSVVRVSERGVIRAGKKTGQAVLTVKLKSKKIGRIKVTVKRGPVATEKIQGLPASISLKKGETYRLAPRLTPLTSTQRLLYRSSDRRILQVSSKGLIKGKKKGTARVTVTSGSRSRRVTVRVYE